MILLLVNSGYMVVRSLYCKYRKVWVICQVLAHTPDESDIAKYHPIGMLRNSITSIVRTQVPAHS